MIFILLALFFSLFCTFRPIKTRNITFDKIIGPLFAVNFLFAFRIIDVDILKSAIIGDGLFVPWKIIIIFIAVAYVSISADATGIFDVIVYQFIKKTNYDGRRLFVFFYLFAAVLTIFTTNSVVILVLTPIILYIGKYTRMNILPLLLGAFFAANTFSMLFYTSNSTNMILATAMNLGFIEYFKVMLIPTLVAGILNISLLYLVFKDSIDLNFKINSYDDFSLNNKKNAYLSIAILISMFLCLLLSDSTNTEVWLIAVYYFLLSFIKDIIYYIYSVFKKQTNSELQSQKNWLMFESGDRHDSFLVALKRMPWAIIVSILCFFVFIEVLGAYDFVDKIAVYLNTVINSVWDAMIIFGVMGIISANFVTNQPMTIFLANLLFNENLTLSYPMIKGAFYSLIIASNLALNLTLSAALTGLMWKNILKLEGVNISFLDFLKRGIFITPIVFIMTLITLYLVVY